jgi:hypothetical protein
MNKMNDEYSVYELGIKQSKSRQKNNTACERDEYLVVQDSSAWHGMARKNKQK